MPEPLTSLSLPLDPEAAEALTAEVRAAAAALRERNYNEEGIPMFLVLEDLTGEGSVPGSGPGLHNTLLAAAAELVLSSLEPGEVGPGEIAATFEVLASQLFTLGVAEPPLPGAEPG